MNQDNYLVVMAGGGGTRFWPFSRNEHPKQFLDVLGTGKTLLQQTVDRFEKICSLENIYIVTSQIYVELVKEQLPFLTNQQILAEPSRKNTAPCIAYACNKIGVKNKNANIIVSPADHIVLDKEEFYKRIVLCVNHAKDSTDLVTLGILPTRPDTGYGYIQFENATSEVKNVLDFTEKPTLDKAKDFITSKKFVWNAGIFIWSFSTFVESFKKQMPEMAVSFEKGDSFYYTEKEIPFINELYEQCISISIDYALMEKSENVKVVFGDFGWSDLGTWKSLYEATEPKDENNNVCDGLIKTFNTKNSIIKTPNEKLVVVQGLDGYIVAEHGNALMICQIDQEQMVKTFVEIAESVNKKFV